MPHAVLSHAHNTLMACLHGHTQHMHTNTGTQKHAQAHASTHTDTQMHARVHAYTHTHTYTQTHMHTHTTQSHLPACKTSQCMWTGSHGHLAAHYTPPACPVCVHVRCHPSWQTADIHLDVSGCWPSSVQCNPAKHLPDYSIPYTYGVQTYLNYGPLDKFVEYIKRWR